MCSRGLLMVIAGPSGAGKTTLARHLVNTFPEACFSVSCTTRKPRGDEKDGVDYRFLTSGEFHRLKSSGYFLEWARVHGHLYGTPIDRVREKLGSGSSVILDIDVQGAFQVKAGMPSAILVFILPPDDRILTARLSGRGTEAAETVRRRMEAASDEVALLGAFDYFIANDRLEDSLDRIATVYRAEGMRLSGLAWPGEAVPYHPGFHGGASRFRGEKVVVCSGPTREGIDDVRFISNRSSGLMGLSLTRAFLDAGARVTMVTGPCRHDDPPGEVELIRVETGEQMLNALSRTVVDCGFLAMAAAVSDFRPGHVQRGKVSRESGLALELVPAPDLLETLEPGCPFLSFSLEFGPAARERALAKMARKGAFATFINPGDSPGEGMESPTNLGELVFADGWSTVVPRASKRFVARALVSIIGERL